MLFNTLLRSLAVASVFTSTLAAPVAAPQSNTAALQTRSPHAQGIVASLNVFVGLYNDATVNVNAGLWTSIPNDLDVITAHVVANVGLLNSQLKAVVSYEDAIIIHASLALWVKTHHTFFLLLNSKHSHISLGAVVDSTHASLLKLNVAITSCSTALYVYIPSSTCKSQFSLLYVSLQTSIKLYAHIFIDLLGIKIII